MNDPIQNYCRSKGYSVFVTEGGLDYLISRWEQAVANIARGCPRMLKEDYLDDMDSRRILHEVLQIANDVQRDQVENRVRAADELYFSHTVSINECIWGEPNEKKHGYTPQIDWWYYRNPKVRETHW